MGLSPGGGELSRKHSLNHFSLPLELDVMSEWVITGAEMCLGQDSDIYTHGRHLSKASAHRSCNSCSVKGGRALVSPSLDSAARSSLSI